MNRFLLLNLAVYWGNTRNFKANMFLWYSTLLSYISTWSHIYCKVYYVVVLTYWSPARWLTVKQWMCQSQQDGVFDRGEKPEHLSLQHLSILFYLPHKKPGPLLQNTAKSSTGLQTDEAGQGAVDLQVGQAHAHFFVYTLVGFICVVIRLKNVRQKCQTVWYHDSCPRGELIWVCPDSAASLKHCFVVLSMLSHCAKLCWKNT